MLDYNGVPFGKRARCARDSFTHMQVLDLAAAYGDTVLDYNAVPFGKGVRCALASLMQVLDMAAASSAASAARPTVTQCWITIL